MRTFCTALLTAIFLWSSPLSAEFCKYTDTGKVRSCEYRVTGLKKQSQVIISYSKQGWSLMAVIFVRDFVMVEGDGTITIGKSEPQTMKHINTRRDITPNGDVMEAAIYGVSEELLHAIANADGGIKLFLPASESKERQIKVNKGRLSDLGAYMAETKAALGL